MLEGRITENLTEVCAAKKIEFAAGVFALGFGMFNIGWACAERTCDLLTLLIGVGFIVLVSFRFFYEACKR